jgi:hypothetical protein
LTAGESTEHDAERLPEIAVGIVGGLAEGAGPQAAEAVSLSIGLAGGECGVRGVEEVALFGAEKEQAAVDQAEELLKVCVRGEGAVVEALAEAGIVGLGQKTTAEDEKGLGDAVAQAITDTKSLGVTFGFPLLPDAVGGRRGRWRLEATTP